MPTSHRLRLLISCADRPGIVSAVSRFLFEAGANIVRSDQFSTDPEGGSFFLRMEFTLPEAGHSRLNEQFGLAVAEPFQMSWRLWHAQQPKRVAIMVSRYDHCLLELLWRWRRCELGAEVVMVVSNHPDLRGEVERLGSPTTTSRSVRTARPEAEAELLELLDQRCDLVVLARYMQIISAEFLERPWRPADQHPPLVPAGVPGREPYARPRTGG